ncbi:hypothetical protein [Nitrosococcus oceani]|uniref:Transmembrane protein n=2 Tax=Nitrosococcus oceani TaxID=1229 RepID=Q3J718_NITOC|nr:hypothetical protein [Nitrosococcus oceani]KFI18114.1 hypothetical protein IB75_15570 [Nitrosococcus oceani C-27]ABA59378.1 hypothetical protein Noc_2933 [Nitrosococcus oceani ATCC 19707]EDZ65999.1 hypothetical protein NOC27_2679 [Nitrosococcus oceani AFC27]KFI21400.1 hypothetical protein HW44_15225 [Nitrosococcus oceani]GEM20051.1 hypothetical protein NONS58_14560 [Nitrosococcus oceani]
MRFFVNGEQRRNTLLNTIILLFLGYIALLWVSNGLMYFHKMGLTPSSVTNYYLGSEADFTQPISYQSLLEVSHFHLFSMGILVLTLAHLMLFTELSTTLKVWLSGLTFFAAVANEAGGWLVRFVHPAFAYFKIGTFLLLEASLAALLIFVSASLIQARGRSRTGRSAPIKRGESYAPQMQMSTRHENNQADRPAFDSNSDNPPVQGPSRSLIKES